jgi:hypothetical protein
MEKDLKVFISQGMRCKSAEEITAEREAAVGYLKESIATEIEVIDTYFKDFDGNRLEFLGKAVSEGIAKADIALFVGNWEAYTGCLCEHFIATQYGVPCLYFKPVLIDCGNGQG